MTRCFQILCLVAGFAGGVAQTHAATPPQRSAPLAACTPQPSTVAIGLGTFIRIHRPAR